MNSRVKLLATQPLDAIEAKRRSLLQAAYDNITEVDVAEIVKSDVELAKQNDGKAKARIMALVTAGIGSRTTVNNNSLTINAERAMNEVRRLLAFVLKDGPLGLEEIKKRTGYDRRTICDAVDSPLFDEVDSGWVTSPIGRRNLEELHRAIAQERNSE